jgi:hypothetical protein
MSRKQKQATLLPDFILNIVSPTRKEHFYAGVYCLGTIQNKETWYVRLPFKKNRQPVPKKLKQAYEVFVKEVKEKTKEIIRKRTGKEPTLDVLVDLPPIFNPA